MKSNCHARPRAFQLLGLKRRHGRACPGHPRLAYFTAEAWMPGTRPGMTVEKLAGINWKMR
jgi:hypothetical protein